MNWFEKHIKWTTVIIFIVGITSSFILCLLCTANYLFINAADITDTPILNRLTVTSLCFILIMFGFGWIFKKRNSSPWFLLLCVLLTFPCMLVVFSSVYFEVHHPFFLWLVPSVLVVICFIILLVLQKYAKNENRPILRSILITSLFSLNWYKKQYSLYRIPFISFVTLLICLFGFTIYSYFSMDNCYKTIEGWSIRDNLDYSFKCPQSFYEPWDWYDHYCGDVSITTLIRQKWLPLSTSSIQIRVWETLDCYGPTENMTPREINLFAVYSSWVGLFDDDDPVDSIIFTSTYVDDSPADRITLIIAERPEEYYWCGTLEAVCFEKYGYIWVLSIFNPEATEYKPSRHFEHLLETFQIHY